jgi:hypothetical protein
LTPAASIRASSMKLPYSAATCRPAGSFEGVSMIERTWSSTSSASKAWRLKEASIGPSRSRMKRVQAPLAWL